MNDASGNITVGNNATVTGGLTVTGTLTGSTGVMNIGSGQLYKDASGNVGIGTSSPNSKLNTYAAANALSIQYVATNQNAVSPTAAIGFNVSDSSETTAACAKGGIGFTRNAAFGGGYLAFYNNNSGAAGNFTTADEKMRIDSSGNVGIGTTSPSYKLHVVGNTCYLTTASGNTEFGTTTTGSSATVSGGFQALQAQSLRIGTFASSGAYNVEFTSQNNVRIVMAAAGNFYPNVDNSITCGASGQRWSAVWAANGTIQTSDINAKTDVVDSPLGLSFIASLRPVAYKYKVGRNQVIDNPEDTDNPTIVPISGKRQHFGLIAQEVKSALPDGVDFGGWAITDLEDPNSEQGLRYDQFIAPMIKAIQEQQATITALTARVAALEAK